ncbi:endonuclease/exonuclease/phosphatase family protein [Streptomyces sp. NPDC101062]|uniref:endonuclease/exonuclease/phosphatase family protein n=1 Tax=unclassified Streptomyces TaxID=2593676 RepID=UPI00382CDCB2
MTRTDRTDSSTDSTDSGDRTDPADAPSPPVARPLHQRLLVGATGLFLLAATVLLGCRALGSDGVTPVPQLLAFLPWLLVPAALALLLAALLRWRAGAVWALVVMGAAGWFLRPYDTGSGTGTGMGSGTNTGSEVRAAGAASGAGSAAPVPLTVLTSNVEYGQATRGLIEVIRREKPDLVFVQECEFRCVELLAEQIPDADYPYRNVVKASSAEGSSILSRFPLTDTARIPGLLAMPGSTARVGDRTVRLQLAHPLPPIPGMVDDWHTELGRIRTFAAAQKAADAPLILAGDFNATRDHATFRSVLDAGGLRDSALLAGAGRTPSWPTDLPRPLGAQIDHVLVSDDFSVRSARFLDLADTDHRSLLVGLELH